VNSIVACCQSAKLCAQAARDFRSQQLHFQHDFSLLIPNPKSEFLHHISFSRYCNFFN